MLLHGERFETPESRCFAPAAVFGESEGVAFLSVDKHVDGEYEGPRAVTSAPPVGDHFGDEQLAVGLEGAEGAADHSSRLLLAL